MNLKTRLRFSAMRYLSSARYLERQPLCTRRSVDYPPGEGINPVLGKADYAWAREHALVSLELG